MITGSLWRDCVGAGRSPSRLVQAIRQCPVMGRRHKGVFPCCGRARRPGLWASHAAGPREQVERASAASNYWSSTENAGNPTNAWNVNFNNGNVNNANKNNALRGRAVRGGR
jgi:hypothetical protein